MPNPSRLATISALTAALAQDLRYAARTLAKNRSLTLIVVLTLTLGIGANAAIFSVVHAVLLADLPYPHPETLVRLVEHEKSAGDVMVSWPDLLDWQRQSAALAAIAAYRSQDYNLTGVAEPTRLHALEASASFFTATRVTLELGRTFSAAEDRPGGPPVLLLGNALWRSMFGADRRILGRSMTLNGVSRTIIGVLPARFWLPQKTDVVVPFGPVAVGDDWLDRGNHNGLRAVARLAPGISLGHANAEMRTIMSRLERQYPRSNSGETAAVIPFHELVVRDVRPTLVMLLAAVAFVLLTACANVANLLLARAAERQREMAVRAALGSGRRRLVQQALCESLLLALAGGAGGLALAAAAMRPLLALAPSDIPRFAAVQLDWGVLAFVLAVSLAAAVLCGLAPALAASRPQVTASLKQGSRGGGASRGSARLRGAVLVTEVALALVLVSGAGLMIRSIAAVDSAGAGFQPDHLLTFGISLPETRYPRPEQQAQFFRQAIDRLSALPGVRAVAAVRCLPMAGGCWDAGYTLGDRPLPPMDQMPEFDSNMVSDGYFATLGIPVVAGRGFSRRDDLDAPPVAVVNQELARRMWPHGGNPIGQRLKQGLPGESQQPWREIVGVVGDVRRDGADAPQHMEVFMPVAQHRFWQGQSSFVVRTAASPMGAARAVAAAIHGLDRDEPLTDVEPMERRMAGSLARRRFSTLLLSLFGAVALLLAAVGIYGVMAYAASLRRREMGIRMALGARRADVFGRLVGQGVGLAAIGTAIGVAASLAVTRLMSKLLFGISATDPLTFAAVALLLAAVAALASFLPARRATLSDPAAVLQAE